MNDSVISRAINGSGYEGEDYADVDIIDAEDRQGEIVGYTLEDLARHTFPERRALLQRGETAIVREGYIVQIDAKRGTGKTLFKQTLALVAATSHPALGFSAPSVFRVLDVDGEMASREIQERYVNLCARLNVPPPPSLTVVAADWQDGFIPRLDTEAGQAAIEPFVEQADLILLDNRSCLFDPDSEKDPSAWQPAQDWLLSLRRRGKAVVIIHHSNRMGGARGHSKPEDVMNVLINLARPEDYRADQGARFVVTFEKSRGAYGSAVAPFMAQLTIDGWKTESADGHQQSSAADRLLDYIRLAHRAGERPKSATAAITGARINRNAGFAAWAELAKRGDIQKHHEGGFYVP